MHQLLAGRDDVEFLVPIFVGFESGRRMVKQSRPRMARGLGGGAESTNLTRCLTVLKHDPDSRRAALTLLQPDAEDLLTSINIPCNNWLQFVVRDGALSLRVVSRSLDAIWGSALDTFVWTVAQEIGRASCRERV